MKTKTLLIALFMLAGFGMAKAEIVTIGNGESYSGILPTHNQWKYSLTEQIYTVAEIGEAGSITSVAFFNYSSDESPTRSLDIYMVHTDKSSFAEGDAWIPFTDGDKVFSGDVTFPAQSLTTITFDKAFAYNGTNNVALIVDDNTGSYGSVVYFLASNTTSYQGRFIYSDDVNYDASIPISGALAALKNDVQFDITRTGSGSGVIEVGDDDSEITNPYLPTYSFYNYSLTQQIYTKDEIGGAAKLTSVSFRNIGNEENRKVDIYLVHTNKTSFDSATDWISVSASDLVFSGEVTFTNHEEDWTVIPFNRPFSYNGEDNLALVMDDNTRSYESSMKFRVYKTEEGQSIRIYDDNINYDPTNSSSYEGTVLDVKNLIRFNEADADIKPMSLSVQDITYNGAVVMWSGIGTAWNLEYKKASDATWTECHNLTEPYCVLSDLERETGYFVCVQIAEAPGVDMTLPGEWVLTSFMTAEQYLKPSNLEVSQVTPYTAKLNWTSRGEETAWQILVGDNIVEADRNPFTLMGLTPGKEYKVYVRAVIGDHEDVSSWSNSVSFTTPLLNPQPTDLMASAAQTSATLSWSGKSSRYIVRYRKAVDYSQASFYESFDDPEVTATGTPLPYGWTSIDADGDGYNWVSSASPGAYHNSSVDLTGKGHNGSESFVLSGSYTNATSTALSPDNYLVMPQVTLGGVFCFYANGQDEDYPHEHFGVAVSTASNDNPEDFVMLDEWTLNADGTGSKSSRRKAQGQWGRFEVDLSAYEGQPGYIAIRHFNTYDEFILNIDDVAIFNSMDPWTTIETTDKEITIDGLDIGTDYEFQVVGLSANCPDAISATELFSTLEANPVPFDVEVAAKQNSAIISWTGYSDNYIIRYREAAGGTAVFFEDFEGLEDYALPSGWTAIDADGDGYNWYSLALDGDGIDSNGNRYYEGNMSLTSASYNGSVLTPDNWLISPQLDLQGTLSVLLRAQDPSWTQEHFAIYLSTTGTDIDDFDTVLLPETEAEGHLVEYRADLSAYEGQRGYIAIRHFNSSDQFRLNLDNFTIIAPTEWNTVTTNDTWTTLTGLTQETDYEFQIIGLKYGEADAETEMFSFTTFGDPINIAFDNEGTSNYDILEANDGKYANVTISNLTLRKDGTWQTFSLPFDLLLKGSVLEGADLRTMESVTILGNVVVMNCLTPLTKIEAGRPYIIKWDGGSNITDPTFNGVTLTKNYEDVVCGDVTFWGMHSKNCFNFTYENAEDYCQRNSHEFTSAKDGDSIKAFECYVYLQNGLDETTNLVYLNTGDNDDYITGIGNIRDINDLNDNDGHNVIYNLAGQRLSKTRKGVNIVNGKKVLVK